MRRFLDRSLFVVSILIALAIGGLVAPTAGRVFIELRGSREVKCVKSLCVGASEGQTLRQLALLSRDLGGVDALICGPSESGELLLLGRVVREACSERSLLVQLSNGVVRTSFAISGGRLAAIKQEPAHPSLDL